MSVQYLSSVYYMLYSNIKKAVNLHLYHSVQSEIYSPLSLWRGSGDWRYFILLYCEPSSSSAQHNIHTVSVVEPTDGPGPHVV